MLGYNLYLALLQLRRHRALTAMLVLTIGLGVGATITMLTVIHVLSRNPLPVRGASLFYPQIDSRPDGWPADGPDPDINLTWVDAANLLAAKRATHQAAMAGGSLLLSTGRPDTLPKLESGRFVTPDFFPMFGVPLLRGHAWSAQDEANGAHVMVISAALSRALFGSLDTVGKVVQAQDAEFTITGVSDDWAPKPLFYNDVGARSFSDGDQFFIPLHSAVAMNLDSSSNRVCWGNESTPSPTSDHCTWLQFWVQLRPDQVASYRTFLVNYRNQQRDLGRFGAKGTTHLYGLAAWLKHLNLVPRDVWMQFSLAACFYVVCLVNIVSLLLTKFLGRAQEVSIRRSLGARRKDVFLQFTSEASLMGAMGGLLGVLFAQLGLAVVHSRPDDYAKVAQTDVAMLCVTLALAVAGSILAAAVPAWRASSIAPALHLKGG